MNEYNFNESNTGKTNEHENNIKKTNDYENNNPYIYVLRLFGILSLIVLIFTFYQRFNEENKILTYNKNDVYYKIQTVDEALYNAKVIQTLKEKGKETIYRINFVNNSGESLIFDWHEDQYKRLLGEENNALTISYSEVSFMTKDKSTGFIDDILLDVVYSKDYIKYSFKNDYKPYTEDNIEDEVEDFLEKVSVTQMEIMKEIPNKENYQVKHVAFLNLFFPFNEGFVLYNK